MSVAITKVNGTPTVSFKDVKCPGWFEHAGKLHVRIPDSTAQGPTVLNAIRLNDVTLQSFGPEDQVYPASAEMSVEYNTG